MKRREYGLFLLAAVILLLPGMAHAASIHDARFFFHLAAPVGKNPCSLRSNPPACNDVVTKGQVGPGYFAYIVISNTDATGGLNSGKFGIDYNGTAGAGVDIFSWTNCSSIDFPSPGWPNADTGTILTWDAASCHHAVASGTVMAIGGYFYLSAYTPDEIEMTPRPLDNRLEVSECNGAVVNLDPTLQNLGWARFTDTGAAEGHAPCNFRNSPCRVRGPQTVAAGQGGINFTVDPEYVAPLGHWIIQGNGQISSSNNASAVVQALGAGSFTLTYRISTGCAEGCQCDYPVNVVGTAGVPAAPPDTSPTTWSRVKGAYR
ncbi:MAG TPA: hypothetical protein VF720_09325 [Candidatus Eisenbacteria bacterium]